jgi:hypothetical protein
LGDWFRRRDADRCGRDDRAPEEVANDSGLRFLGEQIVAIQK